MTKFFQAPPPLLPNIIPWADGDSLHGVAVIDTFGSVGVGIVSPGFSYVPRRGVPGGFFAGGPPQAIEGDYRVINLFSPW